mmetsp:Transcript_35842/g.40639  ORF Transcript_35842/g.40639 Transcript_35842/m.40639 type:complete len:129 (+) Transcript_35842:363-749(+)
MDRNGTEGIQDDRCIDYRTCDLVVVMILGFHNPEISVSFRSGLSTVLYIQRKRRSEDVKNIAFYIVRLFVRNARMIMTKIEYEPVCGVLLSSSPTCPCVSSDGDKRMTMMYQWRFEAVISRGEMDHMD